MRIAVTGSNGKLGSVAVRALRSAGHRVTGFDLASSVYGDDTVRLDCADFGAVIGALSGVDTAARRFDAVLHLAGIPKPGATTDEEAFRINVLGTYNVFSAAARLGIGRVVWASSETILGLPFDSEYGGTGTGALMLNIAIEQIAMSCASSSLILMLKSIVSMVASILALFPFGLLKFNLKPPSPHFQDTVVIARASLTMSSPMIC